VEGQGRTLEEIDTIYIERVRPWKSSKLGCTPPPEDMDRIRKQAAGLEADERTNEPAGGNLPAERLVTHYEEA
jgi:SP family sugar:H+ symporter-like MFS transporter